MRLVVIIATADRKPVVSRTLAHLGGQTRLPDMVVVSAPDDSHVDAGGNPGYPVAHVFARRGACTQRNRALDCAAIRDADVVVFFDDDFVPANDYLERVEAAFEREPGWSVLTGHVVADGVKGPGLDFDDAIRLLDRPCPADRSREDRITTAGAYGCNMACRAAAIGPLRFDERLPLYAWQEDTDFSRRVARGRPVIRLHALRGVHLGVKGGRVSGVRFGYSQIANPVYLVRKGTGSVRWAASLIVRNMLANAALSLRPEVHVDRPGRLRGNLIALGHVLRGRIDPEFIVHL